MIGECQRYFGVNADDLDCSLASQPRAIDDLRSHERLYPKIGYDSSLMEPSYMDKSFEMEIGEGKKGGDYFGDCE